jgi:hypothetical protein
LARSLWSWARKACSWSRRRFFFQGGGDARAEHDRIEGFRHEILGAGLDTAHGAFDVVEGGEHDDGQVAQTLVGLHELEGLEAIKFRHDDIQQDEIEIAFLEHLQGEPAIADLGDLVAEFLQTTAQHLAVHAVVIDDEQAGGWQLRGGRDQLGGGMRRRGHRAEAGARTKGGRGGQA